MTTIQLVYDPLSVIPSDWDYISEQLEDISDRFEFIDLFDKDDVDENIPVIYISNLNLFQAEVVDSEKLIVETKHLDLIEESVLAIERLLNAK